MTSQPPPEASAPTGPAMERPEVLASIGERGLVRRIAARAPTGPDTVLGIGDDAAALQFSDSHLTVVSTDRVPSDLIALDLGVMNYSMLGRYIVEVNVSDIVAMGAKPSAFLLNLSLPSTTSVDQFESLVDGVARRCEELSIGWIGGDCKRSDEPSFVGVAIGHALGAHLVCRDGASPGDSVVVTGSLGACGAALMYFSRSDQSVSVSSATEETLLQRLIEPVARLDLAGTLFSWASASMDITDGLGSSLLELAKATNCAIEISAEAIPIHPAAEEVGELFGIEPLNFALGIGLDLELLCTVGQGVTSPGVSIGTVSEGPSSESIIRSGGSSIHIGEGFEHFSRSATDSIVGRENARH